MLSTEVKMKRVLIILAAGCLLIATAYAFRGHLPSALRVATGGSKATISTRLAQYGPAARKRWQPYFGKAALTYPPAELALVGIKDKDTLEVYARAAGQPWRPVRTYPILAASGGPGPKLREGDSQVPEGIYGIESLNPNSRFHLALRVNYPNAFDREQAAKDKRTNLGGDIMIHGNSVSIGCLAMGDEAAEDLFVLAADTGIQKITVLLAPVDFRQGKTVPANAKLPAWAPGLYQTIRERLKDFPQPKSP
jgi:hypothetical protein